LPLVWAQSTALWSIGMGSAAPGPCCENALRAEGTCSKRVAKLAGGALGGATAGAGKLRGASSIVPAIGFGATGRVGFGTAATPALGAADGGLQAGAGTFQAGAGASLREAGPSKSGGATEA